MDILQRLNGAIAAAGPGMSANDLAMLNMQLEAKLLALSSELSATRSENSALRRNVRRHRPDWSTVVRRAQRDALLMLAMAMGGTETTRATCADMLGMSNRRWSWGRALGQVAGVHDGAEFYDNLGMRDATQRVRDAVAVVERDPSILRQFLPRSFVRR